MPSTTTTWRSISPTTTTWRSISPTTTIWGQYPPQQPYGTQYPPQQPYGGQYPSQQPLHIGADIGGVHIGATFGNSNGNGYVAQPGYYQKTKGSFPKVYYYRYEGDPNPIEVEDCSFASKFEDLGGGYGKDAFNIYFEGHKINFDGFTNKFIVTNAMGRQAQDSFGNLYIYGKKK